MRTIKIKRILSCAIVVCSVFLFSNFIAFHAGYCFTVGPCLLICPNVLYVLTVVIGILSAIISYNKDAPVRKIVYISMVTLLIVSMTFLSFSLMVEPEITRLDLKETKKTVLVVEYNHFADSIGYVYERLNPFLLKRDTEYSVDGVKTIHNRGYDYEWVDNELVLGIAQEQYHQEIPTSIEK